MVEQLSITPVLEGDADWSLPEGTGQHRQEHQTGQHRGKDAALVHSIGHLKRIRGISIVKNTAHHPIVKLSYDLYEPVRATKLRHDLPQSLFAHGVEGFC